MTPFSGEQQAGGRRGFVFTTVSGDVIFKADMSQAEAEALVEDWGLSGGTAADVPLAPTGVTITSGTSLPIVLDWQPNTEAVLGYKVYRQRALGAIVMVKDIAIADVPSGTSPSMWTVAGIAPAPAAGVREDFYVTAYNSAGESDPSSTVTVTPATGTGGGDDELSGHPALDAVIADPFIEPYPRTKFPNRLIPSSVTLEDSPTSASIRDTIVAAERNARAALFTTGEMTPFWTGDPQQGDQLYTVWRITSAANPWATATPFTVNGAQLRWYVPNRTGQVAAAGGGSDNQTSFQSLGHKPPTGQGPSMDDLYHGGTTGHWRLRGWRAAIDHAGKRIGAFNWSVVDLEHENTRTQPTVPVLSTANVNGVPSAMGWGIEWAGVIRAATVKAAISAAGSVNSPDLDALKWMIPHTLRATFHNTWHLTGQNYRAPATQTDQTGIRATGVTMGQILRLDPSMSDADVLARRLGRAPSGTAPDGQSWADKRLLTLWGIIFALRDRGMTPADGGGIVGYTIACEHDLTGKWAEVWGPENVLWAEIIRNANANVTPGDSGGRAANAGIPSDRFQALNGSPIPN